MNDYISRAEALKEISEYQGGAVNKVVAKELLEAMPVADVVEVVRCKDCKHYIYDGDRWLCKVLSNNYEPIVDLDSDGYCSKGERRTDGEIH